MATSPTPQNDLSSWLLLFNAGVTALTTVVSVLAQAIGWVSFRRTGNRTVESILEGSRVNEEDKKFAKNQIWWLRKKFSFSVVAFVILSVISITLWYLTKPAARHTINGLEIPISTLEIASEEWVKSNPIFRTMIERLATEGQSAELRGAIQDWRLFKGSSRPLGTFSGGQPPTNTKVRLTYSYDDYRVVLYAFIVRDIAGKKLYAFLEPTGADNGHIEFEIPESEPQDSLLLVGRISGVKAKLIASLEYAIKVEVKGP